MRLYIRWKTSASLEGTFSRTCVVRSALDNALSFSASSGLNSFVCVRLNRFIPLLLYLTLSRHSCVIGLCIRIWTSPLTPLIRHLLCPCTNRTSRRTSHTCIMSVWVLSPTSRHKITLPSSPHPSPSTLLFLYHLPTDLDIPPLPTAYRDDFSVAKWHELYPQTHAP